MPKAVVDIFKTIDVNKQYRWLSFVDTGEFKCCRDVFKHERSVWKSCQGVHEGVVEQSGLSDGVSPNTLYDTSSNRNSKDNDRDCTNKSIRGIFGVSNGEN